MQNHLLSIILLACVMTATAQTPGPYALNNLHVDLAEQPNNHDLPRFYTSPYLNPCSPHDKPGFRFVLPNKLPTFIVKYFNGN